MQTFRPSPIRALTSSFAGVFSIGILGALMVGGLHFAILMDRAQHPRSALPEALARWIDLTLGGLFGLLMLVVAMRSLFSIGGTRYEMGATELVLHRGAVWRHTSTLDLAAITRIEYVSGPISRLFGLRDLRIYTPRDPARSPGSVEWPAASLLGLKNGEEVRRLLLDRRDQLHEAVLAGDHTVSRTPQELHLQRLATAIERLERRLPGSSKGI